MKRTPKLYLKLFLSTLQLSAFTFGGGYVIVPLMQKKFVEKYKWISKDEMLDIVAISQSSPGAIAINASIMIGYRIGGVLGSLCTLLGAILPPLVIISMVSFIYAAFRDNTYVSNFLRGMQAGISAVIVDVIYKMSKAFFKQKDLLSIGLMMIAFCLSFFLSVNVIFIILGAIIFSIIYYFINKYYKSKKAKKADETKGIESNNHISKDKESNTNDFDIDSQKKDKESNTNDFDIDSQNKEDKDDIS